MKEVLSILEKVAEQTELYLKLSEERDKAEGELDDFCCETETIIGGMVDKRDDSPHCRYCGSVLGRSTVTPVDEEEIENDPEIKARRDKERMMEADFNALEDKVNDVYNRVDDLVADFYTAIERHPVFKRAKLYIEVWSEIL